MGNSSSSASRVVHQTFLGTPAEAEEVPGEPLQVVANTLQGVELCVSACTTDCVKTLKEHLAAQMEGSPCATRLQLVHGVRKLKDVETLLEAGLAEEGARLTIIMGPPIPPWAGELGFEPEHCSWLREHYSHYELPATDWLDDDAAVWQKLREEYEQRTEQMKSSSCWGHRLHLVADGRPVGQVRAVPGATINLHVQGWVWNKNKDTCIQQVGLALGPLKGKEDDAFVAEIYDGVPSRPQKINEANVKVTAPEEPGAYMLFRFNDLQYSFADALRNFRNRNRAVHANQYPSLFVGWLIVE